MSGSRMEEEAHREAMLRALAEADAAQQLRTDEPRMDTDRQFELPLLPSEMMEPIPLTVTSPEGTSQPHFVEVQGTPPQDVDSDVAMTQ